MSTQSQRTLVDVLQSTSDCIFPAELGEASVAVDSAGANGDTPLHVLLWRGDTEGALLLVANGADANAVGDMGETPVHVAIRRGNLEVARALVAAGANPDIVSEFGDTPRGLAKAAELDLWA